MDPNDRRNPGSIPGSPILFRLFIHRSPFFCMIFGCRAGVKNERSLPVCTILTEQGLARGWNGCLAGSYCRVRWVEEGDNALVQGSSALAASLPGMTRKGNRSAPN